MSSAQQNKYAVLISGLIALSVIFIRVIPIESSGRSLGHDPSQRIIENIIGDINIQNNQQIPTSSRKLSESNSPQSNSFYDKYDISPAEEITDAKKIYRGGFSACHRFKTFLAIQFSTST